MPSKSRLPIRLLSALSFAVLLPACGSVPKTGVIDHVAYLDHMVVVTPDASLRACLPRPAKPDLTGADAQKNLATVITQLDERGEDCAGKLSATWQSIDQANTKAAAANAAPAK